MGIILTVDFEADWGGRVNTIHAIDKMTGPLLEALDSVGAKATFFVSAEIAGAAAGWVRAIAAAGHEVASHGHRHNLRYDLLSRAELFEQGKRSKEILEDMTGEPVWGFRTPQFRKNPHTEETLVELGYRYDSSSVLANLPGRYRKAQHKNRNLPEFSVASIYRLFPAGIKWINLLGSQYSGKGSQIVYVHLFDLLRLTDTVRAASPEIGKHVLLFYLARLGSPLRTLERLVGGSVTLRSLLSES